MCAPRRSPSCQPSDGGCRRRQPGHFLESASLHPPQAALRRFPRRPLQKRKTPMRGCLSFLEQHFCCAKVVACGRVIEREWGNPHRFPPHTPPSLQYTEGADNKTCGQSQNTTLQVVFFSCAPQRSPSCQPAAGGYRVSTYCAIFRVVMTRKWGRWTRFRQNNRYFAFFLAMEKSMWYTGAEYNSECAGGLHRCGFGAPLLRAVAGNVCTHDRDMVHRRRRDIAAPHGGLTEPGRRP